MCAKRCPEGVTTMTPSPKSYQGNAKPGALRPPAFINRESPSPAVRSKRLLAERGWNHGYEAYCSQVGQEKAHSPSTSFTGTQSMTWALAVRKRWELRAARTAQIGALHSEKIFPGPLQASPADLVLNMGAHDVCRVDKLRLQLSASTSNTMSVSMRAT